MNRPFFHRLCFTSVRRHQLSCIVMFGFGCLFYLLVRSFVYSQSNIILKCSRSIDLTLCAIWCLPCSLEIIIIIIIIIICTRILSSLPAYYHYYLYTCRLVCPLIKGNMWTYLIASYNVRYAFWYTCNQCVCNTETCYTNIDMIDCNRITVKHTCDLYMFDHRFLVTNWHVHSHILYNTQII